MYAAKTYKQYSLVFIDQILPVSRELIGYLYIRVIHVLVLNGKICEHPYPIGTADDKIWKGQINNELYFQITDAEFQNGKKE